MKILKSCIYGFAIILFASLNIQCKGNQKDEKSAQETDTKRMEITSIEKTDYGTTPEGESVDKYTLKNQKGMEVDIITYGGIITSLPNKDGLCEDVVLGFDSIAQYTKSSPYFWGYNW